jgi:hypothetical protein
MMSKTRDGSADLADPSQVSHEHVRVRLRDWRDRVHELYSNIEQALQSTDFRIDRGSAQMAASI